MKMFKEIKPTKYLIVLNLGYVTNEYGPEVLAEFYAKSQETLTLEFAKFLGENFKDIYFYCRDKSQTISSIQLVEVENGDDARIVLSYPINIWD